MCAFFVKITKILQIGVAPGIHALYRYCKKRCVCVLLKGTNLGFFSTYLDKRGYIYVHKPDGCQNEG